jgi:hypothetical protein
LRRSKLGQRRFFTVKFPALIPLLIILSLITAIAAGCGEKPDEPVVNEPAVVVPEPVEVEVEPEPEEPEFAFAFPFTGLGTDVENKVRPVMVFVENSPRARPQSGLHEADMVFEILAEGDITRFLAVYQSKSPEVIGPVRSARPYFVEIGSGLDAMIVHAGWSQAAMNMFVERKLAHFDQVYGDHAYYWRDNTRKAPHNLYTNIEKIRQGAEDKRFRKEWNTVKLNYLDKAALVSGESALKMDIHYINGYYVSYEYDKETGLYSRFMLGEPHKDKETEIQITASNILVAEGAHKVLDNVGRRAVDVLGPGVGKLFQQGKVQEVTWESKDGIIRAYDSEGKELELVPGVTWFHVVPKGSKIDITAS